MEPSASSGKRILIIGGILLVILLAIVTAFLSNRGVPPRQSSSQSKTGTPATPADLANILAYKPPVGTHYTGLGDINFIPSKINSFTIDREKILKSAKNAYPNLSQEELIATVRQSLFYWLAMNDFYNTSDKSKISATYQSGNLSNFPAIDNEFHQMGVEYSKHEIKVGGFYLKVRFAGVRQDNIQKLGKKESELRSLALQKIREYKGGADIFTDKSRAVDYINNDKVVLLLNNGEKSMRFANSSLYPPLVADPNYYTWMQRLLVGQFSDMLTLKQYDAQKGAQEDYAFAYFYLTKKDGNHLPLNVLTDQFINKSTIQ